MDQRTNTGSARPMSAGRFMDKVAWICVRDRKLLMGRPKDSKHFINIGGKRERVPDSRAMETDIEVLVREVREETGVEIIPDSAVFLHLFKGETKGKIPLHIACYAAEHLGLPEPKGELQELKWLSSADKNLTTALGAEILEWLRAQKIID